MSDRIVRFLIHLFFRLFVRLEIIGLDNLPARGGFIVAANHLGRLDVPLVYHLLERHDVTLMVAEKYQKYAIYRWLVDNMDAIWVDRFGADFSALRTMLKRLRQGSVLVIAPEGTRSPTGALIEGRSGVSYLAAKAAVPIVPAGATGTQDHLVKSRLLRFKKPHVTLMVGKPFSLPPLDGREREVQLEGYTTEIMCQIASLLPAEYRGVYADHPRLQALLKEQAPG